MIVKLNKEEVEFCKSIAKLRSENARKCGVKDAKIGLQSGLEGDIIGFLAEFAVAKHFNVFPDLGITPRSGSADGIMKGKAYDVKATSRANGRLLATLKENPDVDIYILAIVNESEINIVGWTKKEDLIKEENIKDLGYGKGYVMDQSKLKRFKEDKEAKICI